MGTHIQDNTCADSPTPNPVFWPSFVVYLVFDFFYKKLYWDFLKGKNDQKTGLSMWSYEQNQQRFNSEAAVRFHGK